MYIYIYQNSVSSSKKQKLFSVTMSNQLIILSDSFTNHTKQTTFHGQEQSSTMSKWVTGIVTA